jgi:hypothetical protein
MPAFRRRDNVREDVPEAQNCILASLSYDCFPDGLARAGTAYLGRSRTSAPGTGRRSWRNLFLYFWIVVDFILMFACCRI